MIDVLELDEFYSYIDYLDEDEEEINEEEEEEEEDDDCDESCYDVDYDDFEDEYFSNRAWKARYMESQQFLRENTVCL